jgi:hypothetical protein
MLCLREGCLWRVGSSGQGANLDAILERALEALLEPVGREARRKAAEAIRRAQA